MSANGLKVCVLFFRPAVVSIKHGDPVSDYEPSADDCITYSNRLSNLCDFNVNYIFLVSREYIIFY